MTIKVIEADIGTAAGGRIPTALLILPSQSAEAEIDCGLKVFLRACGSSVKCLEQDFSARQISQLLSSQSIEPWEIPFSYRRALRYVTVSAHSGIGWAAADKKDAGLGLVISYFARSRH